MAKLAIENGQKVVMIGDSITDCGRRAEAAPLGAGYVGLLVEMITAKWPELDIEWINMGIGGNTVTDLRGRWQEDVMAHAPDWLTVKIGINDLHRYLNDVPESVPVDLFRTTYDDILTQAVEGFGPKLMLIDPFYVALGDTEDEHQQKVLALMPEYIGVVHEMAEKYGARLVETHEVFKTQLKHREPAFFCPEPVHPFRVGHAIIANAVLDGLTDA